MAADPLGAHGVGNVLVVGRPAEADKCLTALASAVGVDVITSSGLPESARPQEIYLPVPVHAVDSIVEWVDAKAPTRSGKATPHYLTTATMPADGPDGVDVVEQIERIEPSGLFAIRTLPRPPCPAPAKAVLFFVTAKDLHVGPAREWVELSRRIAATGSQAVRWDPAGLGLSGQISRDPWRNVYSKADITDSIAAARHACHDAGELEVVGICSGSWYAAQTARVIGARAAILVNVMVWNWHVTSTVPSQWYNRQRAMNAGAPGDSIVGSDESAAKRLKTLLNPGREPAKMLLHSHFPRSVLRVLSRAGLVWLPEVFLTALTRRGVDVTLIASPEDADQFTAKGGRAAIGRLQGFARPPRLIATPDGDHSGHHPAILAEVRKAVLPVTAYASAQMP